MTTAYTSSEDDRPYAEAVQWFLLLKEEPVADQDRAAFATWLASDARHQGAVDRAEALWGRFDIVAPEYRRMERHRMTRRTMLGIGAAGMVGLASWRFANLGRMMADHTTQVAERRSLWLADGSMVELGSYSALSVDFSGPERQITLLEGQAYFDLRAGATPAVVSARGARIATAGAQLDIHLSSQKTSVFVAENRAELRIPGAAPVALGRNMLGIIDQTGLLQSLQADPDRVMAWRKDRVVFDDIPLREVLEELGRYRSAPIMFTGGPAADLPVTAVFHLDDVDQALDIIAETLPVRLRRTVGGLVIVSSA